MGRKSDIMKQIIEDLKKPDALPDNTGNVDVVQTHISVVFIADSFVYKIKKPVDFGFLDFSTLEKRYYYCHEEVTLNRRLGQRSICGCASGNARKRKIYPFGTRGGTGRICGKNEANSR